jgi:hypothetical protein
MSWDEAYPHSVYASVLLNEEGKILNWRIGSYYWKQPIEAKMRFRDYAKISLLTVRYKEFIVNNDYEHDKAFEVDAIEFFKQFELAEDHIGASPFEEDDFFDCEGVEVEKK